MRLKLILVFCGLMAFVCPSFSNESFMNYINRYEKIDFPYTLRCMSNTDQFNDIGTTELESVFGYVAEAQSFDANIYDSDKRLEDISVSANMIGYFFSDKYIVVLATIITEADKKDSHAQIYAFVFTENGDLTDRLLVGDTNVSEMKYFYSILSDDKHISTFDYLEDFSDYESLKSSYYIETVDYELKNDGKFEKGSPKRIDLEDDLNHYLICPIPEDDPMFRASE